MRPRRINPIRRSIVILLAACSLAAAPGPAGPYLAARDQALRTYLTPTPADEARAPAVLAALDPLIAAAVGPVAIKGFPPKGTGNVDTLAPEMGYGKLDGIRLSSGKTELLVSTQPLMQAWLGDGRFWDGADRPAFGSPGFLFAARRPDAAIMPTAALPVTGGDARALLFRYAQDNVGAMPPNQIAVSVLRGDRVYLFAAAVDVAPVPACTAAHARDTAAVDALLADYRRGGARDQALFQRAIKASEDAGSKARSCVADRIKATPAWAGLVGTAQRLVDLTAP